MALKNKLRRKREFITLLGSLGGSLELGPNISVAGAKTISEDASTPLVLGAISVLRDGGHSWVVGIKSGGDPDSKFDVNDGDLRLVASVDSETKTSHSVTLEGTADGQENIERTFIYQVLNVIETPVFLSPPAITGAAQVGQHLSLQTPGVLQSPDGDGAERSYQWYLDGETPSAIEGATNPDDLDTSSLQEGDEVFLRETATNVADSATSDSNVIGPLAAASEALSSLLHFHRGDVTILNIGG